MRRAILQARRSGDGAGVPHCATPRSVRELMGGAYPELHEQREAIERWLASEEDGFGRTLEQGTKLLDELIARALGREAAVIAAADAFALHDTYGFPFDLTRELAAEHGLGVDEEGFEELMERSARPRPGRPPPARSGARVRARSIPASSPANSRPAPLRPASPGMRPRVSRRQSGLSPRRGPRTQRPSRSPPSRGPARKRSPPASPARASREARRVPVLPGRRRAGRLTPARSNAPPATAAARVTNVYRLGDDQALAVVIEQGSARSPRSRCSRASTTPRGAPPSATTPPPTSCTRPCASASAATSVRPAPTSGRTSCASTSPTPAALSAEELRDVEDSVNAWIVAGDPVRAISTTLEEAQAASARWRCSARSTAMSYAWCRSATAPTRASSAAARTSAARPRSAPFTSSARPPALPTCAASRRSPARARWNCLREHDRLLARDRRRAAHPSAGGARCPTRPRGRAPRAGALQLREGAGPRAERSTSRRLRAPRSPWPARPCSPRPYRCPTRMR